MIIESFVNFMSRIMLFSAYINNASNFPQPLTCKQEKEEFEKVWSGDNKAKEKLILHNLRLVAHVVKKYTTAGEADDLISVGTIGLIKAINTFRYDKNTQFSTYAARCIENEILMLIRANKKHQNVIALNECLGQDKEGNEVCLMDIIPSDEDLEEDACNNILIEKLENVIKTCLSKREYQIICLRYGLNNTPSYTQREVAQKLGISRSYISRLEKKAVGIIKQKSKEKNIFFA